MTRFNVLSLLIAVGLGVAVANFSRASAEPQPAWDRDLSRQLLQTQEKQQSALEAIARSQEQAARALQELVRATERTADKCSR